MAHRDARFGNQALILGKPKVELIKDTPQDVVGNFLRQIKTNASVLAQAEWQIAIFGAWTCILKASRIELIRVCPECRMTM